MRHLIIAGSFLMFGPALGIAAAGPCVINVPTDFQTIQEAINAATAGCTILVAPGTYTGPGNRDLDFGGKAITVQSTAGAQTTILDGELNRRLFNFHSSETASSVLDGFTIYKGVAGPMGEGLGGGILCSGASPTIQNCIFDHCEGTSGSGLGMSAASPTITDCVFSNNGAFLQARHGAGISCNDGSTPTIRRCRFERNIACCAADGGAIACDSSSPLIQDCDFISNGGENGGAISCLFAGSAPHIEECRFINNDAERGGAILAYGGASPLIVNSVFCDNTSAFGSTILSEGATVTLNGCTVVRGSYFMGPVGAIASWTHAGVPQSQVILDHTIVAFNKGNAVDCIDGTISLSCCDVFGNVGNYVDCLTGLDGVNGNFGADPRFCNLEECDLSLDPGSPCLPGQHPQGAPCELVGALGVGCGATSVESTTWGQIKSRFGDDPK